MIPFIPTDNDDIIFISENFFLSADQLYELYDIFFLSFQPGTRVQQKISPIIRSGTISLMENNNIFLIDAAAFPGNSGSPVFLKPSAIRYHEEGNFVLEDKDMLGGKLIGIVGEYLPYRDLAISIQTHRPRIEFEENTGLSRVWSISFIQEIINSVPFRQQVDRIKKLV